jgi:hypothetical protein
MKIKSFFLFAISLNIFISYAYSQSNAEVVDYKDVYVYDKSKVSQTRTVTIQINNRAGEEYGEVKIYYSNLEKLSDVSIRLEDQTGNLIRTLSKNEISDKSAISQGALYEDNYVKKVLVKHNLYPYRVTYKYTITSKNYIDIANWSPVVFNDIPTKQATLKVIIPKGLKINVTTLAMGDCKKDSVASNVELTWKGNYEKQIKNEIFASSSDFYSRVIVAPETFSYGLSGELRSWETFGKWYCNLTKGLDELEEVDKLKVKELIADVSDKWQIVRILYRYLQENTRYVNVSIGIGGLKPYPASYVSQNRYGDCKALTTYMKALLKAAGIASNYVLIHAGDQPKKLLREAVVPQFNHVILAVPVNRDTIWLDNTSNINPCGYLGLFTQNREALLVDERGSRIIHVPAMSFCETANERSLTFNMNTAGHVTMNWKSKFRGDDFDRFSQINSDMSQESKDKFVRNYMPLNNYEVIDWNIVKASRDSSYIGFNANINVYKYLKLLGEDMYFSLYPVEMPNFELPSARTLPLDISYPIGVMDTLIYCYPCGYAFCGEAKAISLATKFGTYSCVFHSSKERLEVIKKLDIYAGRYTLAQYSEFYDFIKTIKGCDTSNVLLKKVKN